MKETFYHGHFFHLTGLSWRLGLWSVLYVALSNRRMGALLKDRYNVTMPIVHHMKL